MTEPVAVVGLGCRLPDAPDPSRFWANLLTGKRSIRPATAAALGIEPNELPGTGPDSPACLLGGWMGPMHLDLTGYQVPPDRLAGVDRLGLWTLDVAAQALRDARQPAAAAAKSAVGEG